METCVYCNGEGYVQDGADDMFGNSISFDTPCVWCNEDDKPRALKGIWTPWAQIVCFECHGPKFPRETYDTSSDRWQDLLKPVELYEDNAITYCDKCNKDVQVHESIAVEHNLVGHLKGLGIEAQMEQTGGMNDAMSITRENGGGYLVTYNFDGEDGFMIGKYDLNEEHGDWDFIEDDSAQCDTFDEAVEYIIQLSDIKWR